MIDPTRFHLQTLPQSPRLGQAARSIGANRSFGLRLRDAQGGEQAWTYASDGEAMQIREGVRGADVVVAMSVEAFDSLLSQWPLAGEEQEAGNDGQYY